MSIHRVQSGLIFDDGFELLDTRWVVSPSDSYTYDEVGKQLTLTHNPTDRGTNALFSIPQEEEELLLQVHADYTPTKIGDEGGIVVWKNSLEKVEFLESENNTQAGTYSVWRAVKRQNLWTFFAERDSAWELFDSTVFLDPTMIGVALRGIPRDGYVPLAIDRVILCRGAHISVGNLNSFYKVELLNELMEVVNTQIVPEGFSGIDLELPTIPFKGKLRIYDKDEVEGYIVTDEQKEFADMYGGDLFLRGTELEVHWKGEAISENNPTNLGALKNNAIEERMLVHNPSTGNVANNIRVRVAVYKEEYGWEWADVAKEVDGVIGTYDDTTVILGDLQPQLNVAFWVKVVKGTANSTMKATHFILEVTND